MPAWLRRGHSTRSPRPPAAGSHGGCGNGTARRPRGWAAQVALSWRRSGGSPGILRRTVASELEEHGLQVGTDGGELRDVDSLPGEQPADLLGVVVALDQHVVALALDPVAGPLEHRGRPGRVAHADAGAGSALAEQRLDRAGGDGAP